MEGPQKLSKYENYMCRLDSHQGNELKDVMNKINETFSKDLHQIFQENDKGGILKNIWENDIKQNRREFFIKIRRKMWHLILGHGTFSMK